MRPVYRVAATIAGAGFASAAYQAVADARDRRRYPPPGGLVGTGPGGRRLHLVSMGEGSPAVVIIPALADNVLQWLPVAGKVAARTRAIAYDRAGVGWSDPPRHPRRTPGLMAADLYAMLHAAGTAPPYVLAGHSIGGIVARQFYAQHPDETAGIVLIDSSHEDQARRFGAAGWRRGPGAYLKVAAQRQARILGARRLASSLGLMPDLADGVPPEYADAARAIALSTRQRRTSVREMLMMTRLRETPPGLGSVPLTVLTALGKMDRDRLRIWVEMQDELAALSSDSLRITAPDAPHYIHQYDPDLVVRAICDLVERVRC